MKLHLWTSALLVGLGLISSVPAAEFEVIQKFGRNADPPAFEVITVPLPDNLTEKEKKDQRPIVWVYAMPEEDGTCPPCEALKGAWQERGKNYPFQLVWREPDESTKPFVESRGYPFLHWRGKDNPSCYHVGWKNEEEQDFIQKWKKSQEPSKSVSLMDQVRGVGNYNATWTWPGDLGQHLRSTHGADTSGLSRAQLEALHDSLHEGRFTGAAATSSSSYCPSGNCPGFKKRKRK